MCERNKIITPISVGGATGGCSPRIPDPASDLLYYKMLVERARQPNSNVDFAELRMAYTRTEYYNPYDADLCTLDEEIISAMESKKFAHGLKIAQQILETNFVNIDAHHLSAIAYGRLGNEEQKNFHLRTAKGLLTSILESGDGKTKKSAFIVISVDEEHAILGVLGLQLKSQKLLGDDGHEYDLLDVYDPKSGRELSLYFNIDIPQNWIETQFP